MDFSIRETDSGELDDTSTSLGDLTGIDADFMIAVAVDSVVIINFKFSDEDNEDEDEDEDGCVVVLNAENL